MPKSKDALRILDQVTGDDDELRAMIEAETLNAQVAQLVYNARIDAKLTQAGLARLVGTSQSVIAPLEDCDYGGHSLGLLQRIAAVLNKRIDIRFRARGRDRALSSRRSPSNDRSAAPTAPKRRRRTPTRN